MFKLMTAACMVALLTSTVANAQVTMNYNGSSIAFPAMAKIDGQVGNQGNVSLVMSQRVPEDGQPKDYDGADWQPGYGLILDVEVLTDRFPVNPDTPFVISMSAEELTQLEYDNAQQNSAQMEQNVQSATVQNAMAQTDDINAQMQALAKRVEAGDMSALAEIEALANRATSVIEPATDAITQGMVELEEFEYHSLVIYEPYLDNLQYQYKMVRGTITITSWNKDGITYAYEGHAIKYYDARDARPNLPEHPLADSDVLYQGAVSDGPISGEVDVKFKFFLDNR